jgi:GNAT superfamily N-acetyltransferase
MALRIETDSSGIDWQRVSDILREVGMAHYAPELHQKAFANSFASVFVFEGDELLGFGRALSDGAYQAALYDIAVRPAQQGRGIGKLIVAHLAERCSFGNIILYASVGKEGFYEASGFSRLKTGMARFKNSEQMRAKGFTE